jgi:hypothetical protein
VTSTFRRTPPAALSEPAADPGLTPAVSRLVLAGR